MDYLLSYDEYKSMTSLFKRKNECDPVEMNPLFPELRSEKWIRFKEIEFELFLKANPASKMTFKDFINQLRINAGLPL